MPALSRSRRGWAISRDEPRDSEPGVPEAFFGSPPPGRHRAFQDRRPTTQDVPAINLVTRPPSGAAAEFAFQKGKLLVFASLHRTRVRVESRARRG